MNTSFVSSTSIDGIGWTLNGLVFCMRISGVYPFSENLGSGAKKGLQRPTKWHLILRYFPMNYYEKITNKLENVFHFLWQKRKRAPHMWDRVKKLIPGSFIETLHQLKKTYLDLAYQNLRVCVFECSPWLSSIFLIRKHNGHEICKRYKLIN